MKKLAPAAFALLAVLCAGVALLWRKPPHYATAAEVAPPDAILFAQLPDIRRSVQRWPATAIARVWDDPEMQHFLARPLAEMPALLRAREHMERLVRIGPREAFIAIVGFDGTTPKFVAGLSFAGSKSEVAALVAGSWEEWRKAWPAGKAELLHRAEWEIETHGAEGKLMAGSFHAGWYFLANDLAALESTLARCKAGSSPGIGGTPALQRAAAPLPADLDAFVFAHPSRIAEHLGRALSRGGATLATEKATEAPSLLAWGLRFEDTQIRDSIFFAGMRGAETPLARRTQPLTAPESLLYGAFVLPSRVELPGTVSHFLTLLPSVAVLAKSGESISWAQFTAAFGPECGLVLDWPAAADAPALSFIFEVRDAARAAEMVESITGPSASGVQWRREEQSGVIHFQAPEDRRSGTAPAMAMTPKFVVLGAQAHAVRAVASRFDGASADVTQSAAFHEVAWRVSTPTTAFAYLDLRSLFERSYETLRPFLAMSLALSPETSPYFDSSRLPSPAVIARHLGPSIYSQTSSDDGVLIESIGSLSFSQTLASLAAAAWSSASPALRDLGKSGAYRATKPPAETPASPGKVDAQAEEAAETSRESENADKKSQINPSHP